MTVGFLPCFSKYNHKKFPSDVFYNTPAYVTKVKTLVGAFIDSDSPISIKDKIGRHDVQTVRPDSADGRQILEWCGWPQHSVYRIDYGDSGFKVIFGLGNSPRLAYVYCIDTTHLSYSGKHR